MTTLSDGVRGAASRSRGGRLRAGAGLSHPFLRTLDSGLTVGRSWTEQGDPGDPAAPAVIELLRDGLAPVLTAVGEPGRLSAVLARVAEELETAPGGVTVTRRSGEHASETFAAWGLAKSGDWDRMATTAAPEPAAGVADAVILDRERDRQAITDLLAVASPATGHRADEPDHTWYGVRSADGSLAAVGAWMRRDGPDGPFAHLGGIATRPDLRGRGAGTAVTARLTADGIRRYGLVTLGVYADNDPARRVYERLGFGVIHEVETWQPTHRRGNTG